MRMTIISCSLRASACVRSDKERTMVTSRYRRRAQRAVVVMFVVLSVGAPIRLSGLPQHAEGALPHDFDEPIRLYTVGLGTFTRPISSGSAEAQAYFNQGFQLMYGF